MGRNELKRLLRQHPEVDVVGEAADAESALPLLEAAMPNLVFLDVQMPGESGLQLAERINQSDISPKPNLVFCTAHEGFALEAFHLNALDYLLKPLSPERLAHTIERVSLPTTQAGYLSYDHAALLRFGESVRLVRLREMDYFETIGNHVLIHCSYGKAWLISSLSRIEQKLDPRYFFRANRGAILRLDAIKSIDADVGKGMLARLEGGAIIEISRRQSQLIRLRLGGLD